MGHFSKVKQASCRLLIAAFILLSMLAASARAGTLDAILGEAHKYVDAKQYDEALKIYERVATALRKDPDLLIEWARVYTYANRHQEAIALFEESRRLYPDKEIAILRELAMQYKYHNEPGLSIECFRRYLVSNPEDISVRMNLAEVLSVFGAEEDALREYEIILSKQPGYKEAQDARGQLVLRQARVFVEKKDYVKALVLYEKISAWLREDPDRLIEWARVYTYADRHAEAIVLFEEVHERYPQKTREILRELGDQYTWNKQLERAVLSHEEYLKLRPEDIKTRLLYAQNLQQLARFDEAMIQYERILAAQPDHVLAREAWNDLVLRKARELVQTKHYEDALSLCLQMSGWLKEDPDRLIEWARVYTYADRHAEAIGLFEEVRERYPQKTGEILRELADQYTWDQQLDKANAIYEEYLKTRPDDFKTRSQYARNLQQVGHLDEARVQYEKIVAAELDNSQARLALNTLVLDEARKHVEAKDYEAALRLYAQMGVWMGRDADRLIEWARVHSYADHHAQAIVIFEEVRNKFPEREKDILKDLAQQYEWSDDLDKAMELYRLHLVIDPDDVQVRDRLSELEARQPNTKEEAPAPENAQLVSDANADMMAQAEDLSWHDRLEEANGLYRKVLERDPANVLARIGLARNLVWDGYHRRGAAEYQKVLTEDPGNLDALEGLAFAYHWDGQDEMALKTLEDLFARDSNRREGQKLYRKIHNSRAPVFSQVNRYSEDSDDLSVMTSGLRGAMRVRPTTTIEGIYDWQKLREPQAESVHGERVGLHLAERFNDYWELNTYLYGTQFNIEDFTPFTTATWVTLRASDAWRFDISYDRETFEDVGALRNKIITDSGSISADFRPNRFWLFSAKYKGGQYSDGNTQNAAMAKAEYRLFQKPYTKLYYNFYYSDWSEIRDNGYFNPKSIVSHVPGIYMSKDVTEKLFIDGQLACGYEWQDPKSNHPTYFGSFGVIYRLTESWLVSLRGEYFNALDTNPDKGYTKQSVMLGIRYNFKELPDRDYDAVRPQRPIGSR